MDVFIPAYLKALSGHLAPYADPNKLVQALLAATNESVNNTDPNLTIKKVFDASFYPAIGVDQETIRHATDYFYAEIFPTLKNHTSPMNGAVQLVKRAVKRGYQIALATNALFPQMAVVHRLKWANLSPDTYPFEIIPSYETFHFAKPNPAYFAELLARLGWPDQPVVMIGDDINNDVIPAQKVGLPVYCVNVDNLPPECMQGTTGYGKINGVMDWLDNTPKEKLQPTYTLPSAMLAILRATPAALQTIFNQLALDTWTTRPVPDEWSLTEILCHLRDVEKEVNLPRIVKVLEENNPFLPGKDTDPWAVERQYIHQDGRLALLRFINDRKELLSRLDQMSDLSWGRQARHAIFGPTSLKELVNIIASHDRLHFHQIFKTIQKLPANTRANRI
jgi:FMN phosphatase YigB (HAD superfamily)